MKNKKSFMTIGIVILIVLIGSFVFYYNGISATSSQDEEVIVHIEEGSHASIILDELDDAGLVKNKLCGKIYLKLNHFSHLEANTYVFNKNMSLPEIFSVIENPDFDHIVKLKITIKEGNTMREVAESFAEILNISSEEVIKEWADKDYLKSLIDDYWFIDESILDDQLLYPLEGYLFPETYFVTEKNPTVASVTKLSLDMMDKKLSAYKEQIEKLKWTPHQFLTFASIVERESLFDEDRPMIAGVFMNRLKDGKKLESDITVNYALQKTGVKVTYSQLQTDSKYNTYKYTGLPIGPISTVSEVTMEACLHPTQHNYFFFFADKEGKVYYSQTYAQHEETVKEHKWY
jgi:conserved hypothetical protein, YceG family